MTGRARDMILDPDQTDRLREVIAEGQYYGMQTFDQALLLHYQAGRITMEDAVAAASSPHDFKLLVAGEGRTSTSMADLQRPNGADSSAGPATEQDPAPAAPGPAEPTPSVVALGGSPAPASAAPPSNGRVSAPPPGLVG
jgi:twitching motility protein PilT